MSLEAKAIQLLSFLAFGKVEETISTLRKFTQGILDPLEKR